MSTTRYNVTMIRWIAVGMVLVLLGCAVEPPPPTPEPTLNGPAPADEPGSCVSCHPQQYTEWLGSSHNYGNALDPTFQALEVTANYFAGAGRGAPIFRQNLLCIGCHAPSAGAYITDPAMGPVGQMNANLTLREASFFHDNPTEGQPFLGREIPYPANGEYLLPPPYRAIELAQSENDSEELRRQRLVTFQGITCDACHKVSGPLDDRFEDPSLCTDDSPECAQEQYAYCMENALDPKCKRRSTGMDPHGEPVFEIGISNFAILFEREGTTRYGPFSDTEAVPATAHDVSSGGTESARNFNIATYLDGTPFEDQPPDHRPYLQSSQFCGSCHDVRLDTDSPATEEVELEPVHGEPFLRLENLFTEWFSSGLNLHPEQRGEAIDPRLQWPDNPYRNPDGSAKRVLCQDCHMSLYPYAPPGTFPGSYTHCEDPDDPDCGLVTATGGARGNLTIPKRKRVSTHNMTGVDIALGHVLPTLEELVGTPGTMLPNQASRDDFKDTLPTYQETDATDATYGLPLSLDARRIALLETSVSLSLAGTPEVIDRSASRETCEATGTCCDENGVCSLPVKAWLTNVNGGHNIAAGFSQERQIWVELTVQDMGRVDSNGDPALVDCELVEGIGELYEDLETLTPKKHIQDSATDLFNRMSGIDPDSDTFQHAMICRGLSGHLIDKPHDETTESEADGLLDDEDILLHRIGNTLPEFEDGTEAISWHTVDLGWPTDGDPVDHNLGAFGAGGDPSASRVLRGDQFHILGLDAYSCELTQNRITLPDLPTVTRSGETVPLGDLGDLKWAATLTSDERLEILYPFPELKALRPHFDDAGRWHLGERFGLAYLTNIFYRICGCEDGECEGPETLTVDGEEYHAQVPWVMTYPTLPINPEYPNASDFHFPVDEHEYDDVMVALNEATDGAVPVEGTRWVESFTFIPLNSNHMPNNRALKMYKPQRHYWDIRVGPDVVGPIRVKARVWYRHFPPEFLRLMARFTEGIYETAVAKGLAEQYYPQGPLVVEGDNAQKWENAANIDNLRRILLDEAEFFVNIGEPREVEMDPTWEEDVEPILQSHCVPCHSDVLRHGNLILHYDDYPQWDYALYADDPNPTQDPRLNLVGAQSSYGNGALVVAGDPEQSLLMEMLTRSDSDLREDGILSRRMPLGTDRLSEHELNTIRRWILTGAR